MITFAFFLVELESSVDFTKIQKPNAQNKYRLCYDCLFINVYYL